MLFPSTGTSHDTANTKITEVVNRDGRTFTVRIIHEGDRYGLNDCLTHDESEPMVEFFDATYIEGFTPLGQFISRYYLKTLAKDDGADYGINLDGGVGVWHVSAQNVADAIAFAHTLNREGA